MQLVALGVLTSMLAAGPVSAAYIQGGYGIDPNPETITCGGQTVGTLAINYYYGWMANGSTPPVYTTADNPPINRNPYTDVGYTDPKNPNRGGALIQATLTLDPKACPMNYQWIQEITGGIGTKGTPPYLDPFERDDNLPFYWTTTEATTAGVGKANGVAGTQFIDIPSQSNLDGNRGNTISFDAALVSYCDMKIHWLAGFQWGYSIDNMGNTVLKPFQWTHNMSAEMTGLITNWASKPTSPYLPDPGQAPDGWTVTDNCCCVPEPGTLACFVSGIAAFGLVRLRRKRRMHHDLQSAA